jgi:hypothetical protein
MADAKNTINKGVPMSNGIGGTVASGESSSGAGGGGFNTQAGQSNPAPQTNSSPSTSSQNNNPGPTNAEYVANAVDTYLGATLLIYAYEDIVMLYIDKVLGFEKVLEEYYKQYKELTGQNLTPEEKELLKEDLKNQKDALIKEYTEGLSKKELKKKFDELKANAFRLKKELMSIPKEFTKSLSEALMPNVIGPVGPNPFSTALKIYITISKIKRAIDSVFITLKLFMTTAEDLGIDKTKPYEEFMGVIAAPLKGLEGILGQVKKKEEEISTDVELQGKLEEAKNEWSYTFAGKKWNAKQVEELARGNEFKIFVFPLTSDNRKDLNKAIKQGETSNNAAKDLKAANATVILKYDEWLNSVVQQLTKSKDIATEPNSYSEGAMGPSA